MEQFAHGTKLNNHCIVRWVGTEMAFAGGSADDGMVTWTHPDVPYLQFISLDVQLENGLVYRMLSQSDDGIGYYGLHLMYREQMDMLSSLECGSIYRTREIIELPIGQANVVVTGCDGENADLRIEIEIGGHIVSCWAAEVHELDNGRLEVIRKDESILIQVDEMRPSQCFQKI